MSQVDDKVKTVVAAETFVQGTIRTQGSLIVDGKIEGNIFDAKTVVVGELGQIQGDISAQTVIIGGKVIGNIQAAKLVQVMTKGQVIGDIRTKSLHIEDGAIFDGACTMNVDSDSTREAGAAANGGLESHAKKGKFVAPLLK